MVMSGRSVHLTTLIFWTVNQGFIHKILLITDNNPSWIGGREEYDHRNYFMIHLHESMGTVWDYTGDPWLSSQAHYWLRYVAWHYWICYTSCGPALLNLLHKLQPGIIEFLTQVVARHYWICYTSCGPALLNMLHKLWPGIIEFVTQVAARHYWIYYASFGLTLLNLLHNLLPGIIDFFKQVAAQHY